MADEWVDNIGAALERPTADAATRQAELAAIRRDASLLAGRTGWALVEAARIGVRYRTPDGSLVLFQPDGHVFTALRALVADNRRLRERLEVTRVWTGDGGDGWRAVELTPEEQDETIESGLDGIGCRDETIRQQKRRIEALKVERCAPGGFGRHEALDRALLATQLVNRWLVEHPAVAERPDWLGLAERAVGALGELYQAIGDGHPEPAP